MPLVSELYDYLCCLAPLNLQMDFDNSGIQVGRMSACVKRVLLALDVTDQVISEAVDLNADVIISHHPLSFTGIKSITDSDFLQKKYLRLIEHGISVISMHTNLDIAEGGVNDSLIDLFDISEKHPLSSDGCGRYGCLREEAELDAFMIKCKAVLNNKFLRFYSAGKKVRKIAVLGGSGGEYLEAAFEQGCDTFISADLKYDRFLRAAEMGINLIDADHFCTENPVIICLRNKLSANFTDVSFIVSEVHQQITDIV